MSNFICVRLYDLGGPNAVPTTLNNSSSKKAKTCYDRRLTMSNRINNGLPGSEKFKCPNNMQISASNVSIISNLKTTVSLKCDCNTNYNMLFHNVNNPICAIRMFNFYHGLRNTNVYIHSDSDSDDSDSDDSDSDDSDYIPNDDDDDDEEGYNNDSDYDKSDEE
jgi:hypothetical protein